ncbi:unnamed protein product [Rotaria sp. Silwood2]|nr:unnamed protein product [Rotaria sp. Silwood2]
MASSEAQYDSIALQYAENHDTWGTRCIERYTVHNCMLKPLLNEHGLLTGKRVLDLACGHGNYTRELKALKCDYILGVDISPEMIKLARTIEHQNPQDIDYMVADVKDLPKSKQPFDLVTGFYLLPYARTRDELLEMVRVIFNQLGENKQFIGLIAIPMSRKEEIDHRKYGFTKYTTVTFSDGCIPDATEYSVTLYNTENEETCAFTAYYYSTLTYEQVFKEAGFKTLQWVPIEFDPYAPNRAFYDDYLKYPPEVGLVAAK